MRGHCVLLQKYHPLTISFRLGQDAPQLAQQDDSYDGRSLAEVSKVISIFTSSRIHFLLLVAMWSRNLPRTRSPLNRHCYVYFTEVSFR